MRRLKSAPPQVEVLSWELVEIRIYDPARKPAFWTGLLRPEQFAVCHFDYKTGTWRTARGTHAASPDEETILIFDTLDEARRYCAEFVAGHPTLFCRIYDHRGTTDEGLCDTVYPAAIADELKKSATGRGQIAKGVLQLAVSGLCVYVDWRVTGVVILGAVVGSKFLFSGLNSIVHGVAAAQAQKQNGECC